MATSPMSDTTGCSQLVKGKMNGQGRRFAPILPTLDNPSATPLVREGQQA